MDSRVSNGLPIALVLWRYVLVIGPSTKEAAYWVYRTPASAITRTFADFWPRQDLLALAVPTRKIIGHLNLDQVSCLVLFVHCYSIRPSTI
jgi:hypothetical protein